jgi:uracil-DNA glycosylase family 4
MTANATAIDKQALAALLDWYVAVGVDIAVDDAPHDRYAESAAREQAGARPAEARVSSPRAPQDIRPPLAGASPAPKTRASVAPLFPEDAARAAEEAASGASDLGDLALRFAAFDGCPFKFMASHFLFGAGKPGARLMILDFAPGEEEERSGVAFSGAPSVLLDNMLASIGFGRETSYLAYFSPWRPPGDKPASAAEEAALLPFARRHVELAAPKVLLILGEPTARAMLQTNLSGLRLQGAWFDCQCGGVTTRAMALPSLANVLKTPSMKSAVWRHLRKVAAALA